MIFVHVALVTWRCISFNMSNRRIFKDYLQPKYKYSDTSLQRASPFAPSLFHGIFLMKFFILSFFTVYEGALCSSVPRLCPVQNVFGLTNSHADFSGGREEEPALRPSVEKQARAERSRDVEAVRGTVKYTSHNVSNLIGYFIVFLKTIIVICKKTFLLLCLKQILEPENRF